MAVAKFSERGGEEVLSLSPPIDTKPGRHFLRKVDALLRFHFKIEPTGLSDQQYSELWAQLKFALDFESRRNSANDNGEKIYL